MALLEASGIGKNFGETKVLRDISLTPVSYTHLTLPTSAYV